MEKNNFSLYKRHMFDPPPTPSYSAMYLPDGSLTIFGRKYLMRKKAEEMRERQIKKQKSANDN